METEKANGQYGKQNPLFMYQGTAGYSIRAELHGSKGDELLRSVDRFQYQLNGGAWQTGTVNSKEIIGTNVVVFVNVPNFGQADTITGVRVYDINGALAGQQSISLKRTSLNVALLRFTFPLIETEE